MIRETLSGLSMFIAAYNNLMYSHSLFIFAWTCAVAVLLVDRTARSRVVRKACCYNY
jgi:hypothetical protein